MLLTHRQAAAVVAIAAAAALGIAYFAQDVLLLIPCELCLWERWPYRIVIGLGILAAVLPRRTGLAVLALAALACLAGVAIAGLHVGVEFGWWPSPLPECNGILVPGAPLPAIPARPCDQPVYLIPRLPISMAAMDLLAAASFAIGLTAYLLSSRRQTT